MPIDGSEFFHVTQPGQYVRRPQLGNGNVPHEGKYLILEAGKRLSLVQVTLIRQLPVIVFHGHSKERPFLFLPLRFHILGLLLFCRIYALCQKPAPCLWLAGQPSMKHRDTRQRSASSVFRQSDRIAVNTSRSES